MVLILPGLAPELLEAIDWPLGRVRRLAPIVGSPEAAWLGLSPTRVESGPLVVAALGVEPPDRSLQFQLSWRGLEDGQVRASDPPTPEESATLKRLLPKLDAKRLTGLFGEGTEHALVLEGFYDLGTTPVALAEGKPLAEVLPEGEQEGALRRYIDDSVNLLSEQEMNRRRTNEGRTPLNLLFPWGHGAPRRMPNLALRRGEALTVEAASLRTRGLARLAGYRPLRLAESLELDWPALKARAPGIVVVEAFGGLGEEESVWLLRQMRSLFEGPVLAIVAAGLLLETEMNGDTPFRADVAEDGSIPQVDLWEAVDRRLTPE